MNALDTEYRHQLRLKFIRLMIAVTIVGTLARFFLINYLPDFLAWLGLVNIALSITVYGVIRGNYLPRFEAELGVGLCVIIIAPLVLFTGGINSQYIYLVPLAPMMAALLGSVTLNWIMAAFLVVCTVGLYFTADFWPDLTGYVFSQEKTRVRSVWLVVSIIIAGGFGMYFRRSYDDQSELLDRLAAVDHLTGLLNRRGLEVRLQEELQRAARSGQPLSVLMIDVDFFKQFNDRHGHAAGDDCLIKVARCLRSQTRAEDINSRYGGEEFLIVLSNTNVCEATIVAEKLRAAITEINPLPDGSGISVTIGIASLAQSNNKEKSPAAEELIRWADSALYRGKEAGRNRVVAYA